MNKKGEICLSGDNPSPSTKITVGCIFGHNYTSMLDKRGNNKLFCTRCGKTKELK